MFIGHACNTYTCYNDTYTVDMKERCLLCGGSQSTVKTSHWVSKKLLIIILYCVFPLLRGRYYVDPM